MRTILNKKKEMEHMTFLINNMGTIITALILIIAVALVIRVMIRDKKAGKGCGGGCSGCAHSCSCHGSVNQGKAK